MTELSWHTSCHGPSFGWCISHCGQLELYSSNPCCSVFSMLCPTCGERRLYHRDWTDTQWEYKKVNVGGRNECQSCWSRGPNPTDWIEVEHRLQMILSWETQNLDLRYQHFMISFLKTIGASRKDWSYHGVLPVREPSDPSTKPRPHVFDPTNYVYNCVMNRAVPDIQQLMGWACPPNSKTLGDCIESLLAYDDEGKKHQWEEVGTPDGAGFFREMSYNYYRIHRLLEWDWFTVRTRSKRLHQFLPPKRHKILLQDQCSCLCVALPHPSTMRCSFCDARGCAMIVHLYRDKLCCRACKAIVESMPTRIAPS